MRHAELLHYIHTIDENDPVVARQLRKRTYRWIALGYLFFYGPMLLSLIGGAGLLYFGITHIDQWGVFPIITAAMLLAFSVVPILPLLQGLRDSEERFVLSVKDFPVLADVLQRVCRQLQVAMPQQVILTNEFNASVRSLPRRLPLLPRRRELTLGVPLLQHISPQQMESVIAHEMAHLSSGDDRSSMTLYRVRLEWEQRVNHWNRLSGNALITLGRFWSSRFLAWWWPRLNRDAFTLARACERYADSQAAKCTSPAVARQALARISCISVMLDRCSQAALTRVYHEHETPNTDCVSVLDGLIEQSYHSPRQDQWMRLATRRCQWHTQTHPSLRERWKSLGGHENELDSLPYPARAIPSAASKWFGDRWNTLRMQFLEHLVGVSRREWAAYHRRVHQGEHEIERLISLGDSTSMIQAAALQRELFDPETALETLNQLPAIDRTRAVKMAIAQCQAEMSDPQCLPFLTEQLNEDDIQQALVAGESLTNFYWRSGQRDQMLAVVQRCDALDHAGFTARRKGKAGFAPHTLSDLELRRLQDWLRQFSEIQTAHLARRTGQDATHVVQHVLSVRAKGSGPTSTDVNQRLLQEMLRQYRRPARLLICTPGGSYSRMAKRLLKRPEFKLC